MLYYILKISESKLNGNVINVILRHKLKKFHRSFPIFDVQYKIVKLYKNDLSELFGNLENKHLKNNKKLIALRFLPLYICGKKFETF